MDDHRRPGHGALGNVVAPLGRRPARRAWTRSGALPILAVGTFGVFFLKSGGMPVEPSPTEHLLSASRPFSVGPDVALTSLEFPLQVNDRVERWMRRFLTSDRKTFETFLSRESVFAPLIQAELRERGMPEQLLYLAMIESGFSTRATSRAGAGGVWQFMGPTAKEYGLRVDRWVDERRDPVKATAAALDYLEWLYDRYDSWYLAAAAYNAGPARVDRALERYAGDRRGEEDIYWDIIQHLPRETRDYVPKMLAALALASEPGRYGFKVHPQLAYEYERVWVPGGTSLSSIAADVGVDVASLKSLNPHLIRDATPPGGFYGLRVPVGRVGDVMASFGGRSSDD
jgi:membrane-bound lytic murein transglycosylase D